MTVKESDILKSRVIATMMDGNLVYQRNGKPFQLLSTKRI